MREHVLTGPLEKARGVIGRYPEPDERFVYQFDEVAVRRFHMVGVTKPLRVEWFVGDDLVNDDTLRPWIGRASAPADRVIERRPES